MPEHVQYEMESEMEEQYNEEIDYMAFMEKFTATKLTSEDGNDDPELLH